MYIEIKDNKLTSWCKKPYKNYVFVDIDYSTFDPEKYTVVDGVLTDISQTEEYKTKEAEAQKASKTAELTSKIEELDKKRVRAIAEPSLRDTESGQTWLEYYNEQIKTLRNQIELL